MLGIKGISFFTPCFLSSLSLSLLGFSPACIALAIYAFLHSFIARRSTGKRVVKGTCQRDKAERSIVIQEGKFSCRWIYIYTRGSKQKETNNGTRSVCVCVLLKGRHAQKSAFYDPYQRKSSILSIMFIKSLRGKRQDVFFSLIFFCPD